MRQYFDKLNYKILANEMDQKTFLFIFHWYYFCFYHGSNICWMKHMFWRNLNRWSIHWPTRKQSLEKTSIVEALHNWMACQNPPIYYTRTLFLGAFPCLYQILRLGNKTQTGGFWPLNNSSIMRQHFNQIEFFNFK